MRGTRAKQLRRIAQQMTVGLPAVNYAPMKRHTDPVRLGHCTRRAYKQLKAGFNTLTHGEKHGFGK